MKVLFITFYDVYNIPAVKIADEMLKRGYEIDFYGENLENIHIRMFLNRGWKIHALEEFDWKKADKYDFIYSALMVPGSNQLLQVKKLVFYFSTTFMDDVSGYGDYTFLQRKLDNGVNKESYSVSHINKILVSEGEAVGNPKFDGKRLLNHKKNRRFVYVDSGHYPFGKEGKECIADMLLNIAKQFPNYELVIKPRYLEKDKNVTHRNSISVYSILLEKTNNYLPNNINYLNYHTDLEQIVRRSDVVITTLSTSYLDAAVLKKGLIIVSGIPTEYGLALNRKHVERFNAIQAESGAMVSYDKVCNFLPNGIQCKREHTEKMVKSVRNSAYIIVNRIERLLEEYRDNIDWEYFIHKRYKKALYLNLGNYLYMVSDDLQFNEIVKYIDKIEMNGVLLNCNNFMYYLQEVEYQKNLVVKNNKKLLMQDENQKSYYLEAIYNLGEFGTIDEKEFGMLDMYLCLRGKHEILVNAKYKLGLKYLLEFEDHINNHSYEKTLADSAYYRLTSTFYIGYAQFYLENFKVAYVYFKQCEDLTGNKHEEAKKYMKSIEKMDVLLA